MTLPSSARAVLLGSAFYFIATGILLLVLKAPVVLPAVAWLRSLSASDLDTYLSIVARGCIGVGAAMLLAVIVATHVPHGVRQRRSDAERE